ncbi:unnamed protein product [Macrosiphum euphorbiae]|uniref:Cuticle protein n=1 Tax=Macrosiphum euphorbiae TaxID=13131 RepID=A0AAV0W552_9HEMI|nr:unnamed protein product [Macrosiphum euphorbiae]
MLATSGLVLVSANPGGSYNYAYNLNDAATGEIRETKACNDQVVYDDKPTIVASKNFISEPMIASVTSGPVINTEFVSSTPASILRSDFDSSRIVQAAAPLIETKIESEPMIYSARAEYSPLPKYAAPLLETKIAAEPLTYVSRPAYAPLPKFSAPITVTAAPMLETRIAAEPLTYVSRPEYAPLPKYSAPITVTAAPMLETRIAAEPLTYVSRPEYAPAAPLVKYASPAPLVVSRPQTPIVHVQAPAQIIKSAQLQSYGSLSTSHSHKSYVNHPQASLKIAAVAPQYYAAAPAAPQYYTAPAMVAKEYHVQAAPAAMEYHSAAPVAWQSAPAPIALKIANPVVHSNVALHQAAAPLFAPAAQYAYRAVSSPASSYQYAKHWNNYEQLAATSQLRYSAAASPQYYSSVIQQPQFDYATATQVQNLGQYDGQELPCEK